MTDFKGYPLAQDYLDYLMQQVDGAMEAYTLYRDRLVAERQALKDEVEASRHPTRDDKRRMRSLDIRIEGMEPKSKAFAEGKVDQWRPGVNDVIDSLQALWNYLETLPETLDDTTLDPNTVRAELRELLEAVSDNAYGLTASERRLGEPHVLPPGLRHGTAVLGALSRAFNRASSSTSAGRTDFSVNHFYAEDFMERERRRLRVVKWLDRLLAIDNSDADAFAPLSEEAFAQTQAEKPKRGKRKHTLEDGHNGQEVFELVDEANPEQRATWTRPSQGGGGRQA